jgi:hypothetical protein
MADSQTSPDDGDHAVVHTPGPWRVIEGTHSADKRFSVASESGEDITGWGCVQQMEGNARLIAASPELLESTQSMLKLCERYLGPLLAGGELTRARAAIEKATGKVV